MFYQKISDLTPLGKLTSKKDWNTLEPVPVPEFISTESLSTEPSLNSYLKSLWFEVAVSKDKNNVPTGNPKKIAKFESKRMNAYNYELYAPMNSKEQTIDVISIESDAFLAHEVSASETVTDFAIIDSLSANYTDISSIIADSISTTMFSADAGAFSSISSTVL